MSSVKVFFMVSAEMGQPWSMLDLPAQISSYLNLATRKFGQAEIPVEDAVAVGVVLDSRHYNPAHCHKWSIVAARIVG